MTTYNKIEHIAHLLTKRGALLATAESCTGGLIGAACTTVSGSSLWYNGGIIAYSNEIKENVLSVPREVLIEHGAVSEVTVLAMAENAARIFNVHCAISVSGIAGPGGGSEEKPVGLVWIGIQSFGKTKAYRNVFDGTRDDVRQQAVDTSLQLLLDSIQ